MKNIRHLTEHEIKQLFDTLLVIKWFGYLYRQELVKSCWTFDPKVRPAIDYIIEVLEQNSQLIQPCLDAPSTAVALEGTGSLEMTLLPRIRGRNPYQRSNSEHAPLRGMSVTSHDGDSKVSCGDDSSPSSPDGAPPSLDPFGLLTGMSPTSGESKCSSVRGGGPPLSHDSAPRRSTLLGKLPFESFIRSSVLSRSISAEERTSIGCGDGGQRSDVAFAGTNHVVAFGDELEHFATEPRHSSNGVGAGQMAGNLPPSLESRADSDYCSQHSKDFTNLSCVPFV